MTPFYYMKVRQKTDLGNRSLAFTAIDSLHCDGTEKNTRKMEQNF